MQSFSGLLEPDESADGEISYREGGLDLASGLDLAARLVTGDVGTRIVVVSAGGLDTHSNQFDHGAGGMSMMFGPMVRGGVITDIDLGDQLDGDVRPTIDPRTMYTACLDWLGMDVEGALGQRFDEVALLR